MSDDFLYVDIDRVRGLITTLNTSADTLKTIDVDQQAAAVATAVDGTGVGAACSALAQSAATAIEAVVQGARTMATTTNTGLNTVIALDQHNAGQLPQGN
ncbi:hypothetical protein JK358_09150 [Nocardia sp. 2]|uniref:ESX-1 secretion-associated protein n=1 Tax=Nocardia acididurans TaxID=2802282 RepID=A0ABS1M1M8_9NOCA|nr:hypothetical protein [Nocardia acididurans]MBL1074563.1 hypothetical protein [Nocardia acididurans]